MSTQKLYMNIYSSFIHKCQILEAAKMSSSRQVDKSTIVHLENGILFSTRKSMSYQATKKTQSKFKGILLNGRNQSEKTT